MNAMQISKADLGDIPDIVSCHREAFPDSFTTRLGRKYLTKNYEWYFSTMDTFLIVARNENHEMLGYAGGLWLHKDSKHGSSTSMLQYAYREAIQALVLRPWLLIHPQMLQNYTLLWKNIKIKLGFTKFTPKEKRAVPLPFVSSLGLVVIGTTQKARGRGAGTALLIAFEEEARLMGVAKMHLSVRQRNQAAITVYKKNGWVIEKEHGKNYNMYRNLDYNR